MTLSTFLIMIGCLKIMKSKKIKFYNFKKIYIEKKYRDNNNVKKILDKIDGMPPVEYVNDLFSLVKSMPVVNNPAEKSGILFLGGIRGDILKRCPGSLGHICCNYYVINLYIGCPLNCTYCILQEYLNQPFTIINVDIEKIFDTLDNIFKKNKKFYRIGTGELGDSLVYDPLTEFSKNFIRFFSNYQGNIFEFKTKTVFIDNIMQVDSPGNIVIGFSLNPEIVIKSHEGFSSSLIERLDAAKKLVKKGYKISLHFDPIINIADFDIKYFDLIKIIFNYISGKDIAWVSLGTFRYLPGLKKMIEYNYPGTDILYDEFVLCSDKKYRYLKPVRLNLYKKIIKFLHSYDKDMLIYLCMESPEIWKKTLGYLPFKEEKLNLIFRDSVLRK